MQKNRGFLAAVVVTVIITWAICAVAWKYEMNKRAAVRESARKAAEMSTPTTPVP
jgi:hypothetical protein